VLGGSLNCPRLRALVLDSNPIACDGAAALAEAPRLAGLRRLTLSCCLIGHRGVHALARSAALGGLAELDLSSNPIGDACRALASSAALTGLHALDLSDITPPVSRGTADRLHERFGDDLTLPG
jgi:Ran GTPase-activating protein (RanGAP) involved in mRNA processing and transport